MKRTIYKLFFGVFLTVAFTSLYACSDKAKKEDNHETTAEADDHDDENQVILTDEQIKTVGVELGTIEKKQLSGTMKANGFLRVPNNNKANATSLFGGIVKTLNVEIGDYVKKGQIIATISNPQFLQIQEEYLSLMSSIEFAEHELKRQNELKEGNVGALKNLQKATTDLNALKTRRASLKQQIQLMGINAASLSNSNLKASILVTSPISGIISDIFAKIGSYVDVSSPIAELVENSALHLDLQVYEKDIPNIKIGQKIDFVLTNNQDKSYLAEVYNIGSSFNSSSKTIAIHSKVIGDKKGLIDGMNVTGIISLNGILTDAVPNDAIVNADGKYYIFYVKDIAEEPHEHKEGETHHHDTKEGITFEKMEVAIGASELGYTAITPVNQIPHKAKIATKGAFFVNAKLSNSGEGHEH